MMIETHTGKNNIHFFIRTII